MGRRELKAVIDELPGSYDEVRFHPDLRTPEGLNLYIDKTEDLRCVDLDAAEKMAPWGVKAAKRLPVDGLPGEPEWLCYAKASLVWGGILRTKRRYDCALQCYGTASQCLRLRGKIDFTYIELFARFSLLRRDERRWDDALSFSEKAVDIARDVSPRDTGIMLVNMGAIASVLDPKQADEAYSEALDHLNRQDGRFYFCALQGLLVAQCDLERFDVARCRIAEVYNLVEDQGRLSLNRIGADWILARLKTETAPNEALEIIEGVELAFEELKMPQYRAIAKIDRTYILYVSGYYDMALDCCRDLLPELPALSFHVEAIEAVRLCKSAIDKRALTAAITSHTRRMLQRSL